MKLKKPDEELLKIVFDRLLLRMKNNNSFFYSKNKIIMNILKETDGHLLFFHQWVQILIKVFNISHQESIVLLKNIAKRKSNGTILFDDLCLRFPLLKNELNQLKFIAPQVVQRSHFEANAYARTLKMMYPEK